MTEHRTELPRQQVRRFDVFAEVKRLEALAEGRPEDEAKGYGIWVAKVVAGRRFGRATGERPERQRVRQEGDDAAGDRRDGRFKHAGDELQTDRTFDQEVIDRMGATFYDRVFAPAVRAAVEGGARYEEFRDTIRADWKPPRPSTKRSSASESRPSRAGN